MSKPTMRIYIDPPLDETPMAITEWAEARGGWGAAMPAWQRIQQAATRSCFEISPSDPLAAAKAYPGIVEALELFQAALTEHRLRDVKKHYSLCLADSAASKALAKIGRK